MQRCFSVAILVAFSLISASCASVTAPRAFNEGIIVYQVEIEAKDTMRNAERLLALHNGLAELPDVESIKLHRDADVNGDRIVSRAEAEAFWTAFVAKYEKELGPLRIRLQDPKK